MIQSRKKDGDKTWRNCTRQQEFLWFWYCWEFGWYRITEMNRKRSWYNCGRNGEKSRRNGRHGKRKKNWKRVRDEKQGKTSAWTRLPGMTWISMRFLTQSTTQCRCAGKNICTRRFGCRSQQQKSGKSGNGWWSFLQRTKKPEKQCRKHFFWWEKKRWIRRQKK